MNSFRFDNINKKIVIDILIIINHYVYTFTR